MLTFLVEPRDLFCVKISCLGRIPAITNMKIRSSVVPVEEYAHGPQTSNMTIIQRCEHKDVTSNRLLLKEALTMLQARNYRKQKQGKLAVRYQSMMQDSAKHFFDLQTWSRLQKRLVLYEAPL
jgi:hypothetical protein